MKKNILIFLFIFCFTGSLNSVFGCVCVPVGGVKKELKEAAAVFSGKLVGAEYRKIAGNEVITSNGETAAGAESETLILKFQVETWWKGKSTQEVLIVTDQTRSADGSKTISDCEFPFEVGKRYLVYAYSDEEDLKTNICSRTKELGKAKSDLRLLGKGWKPKNKKLQSK